MVCVQGGVSALERFQTSSWWGFWERQLVRHRWEFGGQLYSGIAEGVSASWCTFGLR